jgi:hypothetical protein
MSSVLFCPATMGFYPDGLTGDAIGQASIEIAFDTYKQLAGRELALDAEGKPVLKSSIPATLDELKAIERAWRDGAISATEWLSTRHREEVDGGRSTTLTPEQYAELLSYRQDLRDWPESPAFPDQVSRPSEPAWLAEQTN